MHSGKTAAKKPSKSAAIEAFDLYYPIKITGGNLARKCGRIKKPVAGDNRKALIVLYHPV